MNVNRVPAVQKETNVDQLTRSILGGTAMNSNVSVIKKKIFLKNNMTFF